MNDTPKNGTLHHPDSGVIANLAEWETVLAIPASAIATAISIDHARRSMIVRTGPDMADALADLGAAQVALQLSRQTSEAPNPVEPETVQITTIVPGGGAFAHVAGMRMSTPWEGTLVQTFAVPVLMARVDHGDGRTTCIQADLQGRRLEVVTMPSEEAEAWIEARTPRNLALVPVPGAIIPEGTP